MCYPGLGGDMKKYTLQKKCKDAHFWKKIFIFWKKCAKSAKNLRKKSAKTTEGKNASKRKF